jgi:hypothetical protein
MNMKKMRMFLCLKFNIIHMELMQDQILRRMEQKSIYLFAMRIKDGGLINGLIGSSQEVFHSII